MITSEGVSYSRRFFFGLFVFSLTDQLILEWEMTSSNPEPVKSDSVAIGSPVATAAIFFQKIFAAKRNMGSADLLHASL